MWARMTLAVGLLALAGCADDSAPFVLAPHDATQSLEVPAPASDFRMSASSLQLRYVCRNTFEVTNSMQVPAALTWRIDNGAASGHVEVPAGGRATFDATRASAGRNVTVYLDAASTQAVGRATNSGATCTEARTGDAGSYLGLFHRCGSTFVVRNASGRNVRVAWDDVASGREGLLSVPARISASEPMTLAFEVPGATSVRLFFASAPIATVAPTTPAPACREGAVLSWTQLAPPSAVNGAIVQPTPAFSRNAIFATNGPDFGTVRVWRFDLASHTWSELAAAGSPSGKYRRIVHDPDNSRLVTFWDGLGQAYALPESGGTWAAIGSSGNSDTHYEGAAFWNPVSRTVNHWGGYGFGSFRPERHSLDGTSGVWTTMPQPAPAPGGRISPSFAMDEAGRRLFVTGGQDTQYLSDLWSLDLASNQWTQIIPIGSGIAAYNGPIAYVAGEGAIYRFGGISSGMATDVLARVNVATPGAGFTSVVVYGARPVPRYGFGLYHDATRNRLVLVSGFVNGTYLNDVWSLQLP